MRLFSFSKKFDKKFLSEFCKVLKILSSNEKMLKIMVYIIYLKFSVNKKKITINSKMHFTNQIKILC